MVRGNIGLKLLALTLAVVLWAALGSDTVTEAVFQVPVEFSNMPTDLEVLYEQTSAQLRVRGPSRALQQASHSDFAVRVDLSFVSGPGDRTFPLDPQAVEVPTSLEVVQMVPSEVRLTFERSVSKEVPVQPRFSGEVSRGRRVKGYKLRPSHLRIAGPSSRVDPIASVSTDPVDITGLSSGETFRTTAYASDPLVRFVDPPAVEVTVELETVIPEASNEAMKTPR